MLCAYGHLYKAATAVIKGNHGSELTKIGRNIALLGLFCPFFWFALFTAADRTTIMFHAIHSSLVFFIGVVIMIFGIVKHKNSQ
jgi:Na+/H+ antiporter NhaD/arsenite permease-like protein